MKQAMVYSLILRNGRVLRWIIGDMGARVPVVHCEYDTVRHCNGSADSLALCDLLEAIILERRLGLYETSGVSEKSPRISCMEMKLVDYQGQWMPVGWDAIAFGGARQNVDHDLQKVRATRLILEKQVGH